MHSVLGGNQSTGAPGESLGNRKERIMRRGKWMAADEAATAREGGAPIFVHNMVS